MDRGQRSWIGRFQYDNKKPCWIGSVVLSETATETEAYDALIKLWHEIFPFDPPKVFEVHKGMYIAIHKEG